MKKWGICFAIVCLGLLGILFFRHGNKDEITCAEMEDGFFIWMDGYVALPVNSEFDIALTYYFFEGKENYIHGEDITAVSFEGAPNIRVKDFRVQNAVCENETYEGYTIYITVEALERGEGYAEAVNLYLDDGTDYMCPVGAWYFDVDEPDAGYVDAYSAVFVSSSSQEFNYNFITDDDWVITELQYWHDKKVTDDVPNSDILYVEGDAPFKYIKAKGLVTVEGEEHPFYGLGSYCGILGAEESDIQLSYERNKMVQ